MTISASVGRSGANRREDVLYVQQLLNCWRHKQGLPAIDVDGLSGPQTCGGIEFFQRKVTGVVDGRVDVGRRTIVALETAYLAADWATYAFRYQQQITDLVQRLLAYRASDPDAARSIAGLVQRLALGRERSNAPPFRQVRLGVGSATAPVVGLALADDLVIIIIIALLGMLATLVQSSEFKKALKELSKIPAALMDSLNSVVDSIAEEVIHVGRLVAHYAEEFEDCKKNQTNPSPQCAQAQLEFRAIELALNAKQSAFMNKILQIAARLQQQGKIDPQIVMQLMNDAQEMQVLLGQLKDALHKVERMCGCGGI